MSTRIKQFMRGMFGKITAEDYKFVKMYLDEYEFELFERLTKYEKLHTIAVGKKVFIILRSKGAINKYDKDRIIKGALLHDIGKIECPTNIIEKSILVIANKIFGEKMKKIRHKKIDVFFNHAEIGYRLLKDREYTEELLNIIRMHHSSEISCKNREEVELIKSIDEIT